MTIHSRKPVWTALVAGATAIIAPANALWAAPSVENVAQPTRLAKAKALKGAVADVMVLYASNDGKGIDPKLRKMPQLRKLPLSAYKSYRLLHHFTRKVAAKKKEKFSLSKSRSLKLALTNIVGKKGKPRYKVTASISNKDGSKALPKVKFITSADEPFFVAGPKHKKGILVVRIVYRPIT